MPKSKIIFLDSDLAELFSNIEETLRTAVQCAIFVQSVDRLIRKQKGRNKSILIAIPNLQRKCFPFWSYPATKKTLQRLRRVGVLKTRIEYKRTDHMGVEHRTRIWVQDARILELAEQVKRERELKELAKKITN